LRHQFPKLPLAARDVVSTYSGVRPVVASGKADPSAESRESAQWSSPGLIGITGGKLTTFRVTARQVLREAARQQPALAPAIDAPVFAPRTHGAEGQRLSGRLGAAAEGISDAPSVEREPLAGSPYCLAELRWSARSESVVHLDDLLLRRTRLGLVVRDGGAELLPRIEPLCREELGWDAAKFSAEATRYRALWQRRHAPPASEPELRA
jgi:glycerol-3-phosphate dehydrogenase